MRRPAEILAAAVVLAAVTGCAAQKAAHSDAGEEDAPPARLASPTGKCIFLDTINDWKAVDPYHLLVRTRATGWQWRVTLDRRCSEMLYANALTWDTIDTRVCDSRADAIVVPRNRCPIGSIEPYEQPPPVRKAPPGGGW